MPSIRREKSRLRPEERIYIELKGHEISRRNLRALNQMPTKKRIKNMT